MATPRSRVREDESSSQRRRTPSVTTVAVPFPAGVARPVVARIRPQVDGGRRPAKASIGDLLRIEADAFVEGHDLMWCELRFRHDDDVKWTSVPMRELGNDRWRATMPIDRLGRYRFIVRASVDRFGTWRRDLRARIDAEQDVKEELLVGAQLIQEASRHAKVNERRRLAEVVDLLRLAGSTSTTIEVAANESCDERHVVFSEWLGDAMSSLGDPAHHVSSETFFVWADPAKARFSAWYELFPRSAAPSPRRHGTFADVELDSTTSSQWALTCCICPPFIPLDVAVERVAMVWSPQVPTIRAVRGPLARAKAVTPRFTQNSARSRTSVRWCERRRPEGSTWRSILPFRRHPIIPG